MTDDVATPSNEDEPAVDATPVPREVERTARLTAQFVRQDIRQEIHSYNGDLPDADELVKLDAAHPGTIERVLCYMDREQEHRHQLQNTWTAQEGAEAVEAARLFARAQWMMFLLAGGAIGGGIVLALVEAPIAALAAIIVAVASLALAFMWGRSAGDRPPSEPPEGDAA